ncbi:MAG: bifunctional riboflavin kinase/FAD synthetase [Candidatus Omnitrophica bacterium]|nr:bifunctional riboflavin kinase/FAD synthetase [Candidatus Omnitrophota bacterium]HOX54514.1 bifunctional riboflavin kinase/FAD synthetase [Candidatus Omnitrophota bacterium]
MKKSMKVYYGIGQFKSKISKPILAIGIFDGVHLGHQYIIKKIVRESLRTNGASVVLTFFPHPYHILKPKRYLPLLISLEHRLKLLADLGVDVCIVQDFTTQFAGIHKNEFIRDFLFRKLKPVEIFVGKDFTFGRRKSGNVKLLYKLSDTYNYKTRVVSPIIIDGKRISSTFIRKLIISGNLKTAARFLGRPVSIFGRIIKGSRRGKILGFPTANIDYRHEILPPRGVYAVRLNLDKEKLFGVANLGFRPSFEKSNKKNKVVAEVYIFDFDKNIYGRTAELEFIKRIRAEKKFKNRQHLIYQIEQDIKKAKQFFRI